MKKIILTAICLSVMAALPGFGFANCDSNTLVQRWVKEQNDAAVTLVRGWVRNVPLSELATPGAVILSNQMYIVSKCRDDERFLQANLLLKNGQNSRGGLEMLPALIIERMVGRDFFSPVALFEER